MRKSLSKIILSALTLLSLPAFAQQNMQMTTDRSAHLPNNNFDSLLNRTLEYAKGHEDFRKLNFKLHEAEFIRLVQEGQTPRTLFVGCSDSRVVPELISNKNPGQLFVVRNAGNFVSEYNPGIPYDGIAASIQYAVEVLGVQDIIVCGHSECGAIEAVFAKPGELNNIKMVDNWLRWGRETKDSVNRILAQQGSDADRYAIAQRVSVLYQLENLMTYPYIANAVQQGKVNLHGWHFTIDTGDIQYYNPEKNTFESLSSLLQASRGNQTQAQQPQLQRSMR